MSLRNCFARTTLLVHTMIFSERKKLYVVFDEWHNRFIRHSLQDNLKILLKLRLNLLLQTSFRQYACPQVMFDVFNAFCIFMKIYNSTTIKNGMVLSVFCPPPYHGFQPDAFCGITTTFRNYSRGIYSLS